MAEYKLFAQTVLDGPSASFRLEDGLTILNVAFDVRWPSCKDSGEWLDTGRNYYAVVNIYKKDRDANG